MYKMDLSEEEARAMGFLENSSGCLMTLSAADGTMLHR